jgi:predicted RecB family nuclease
LDLNASDIYDHYQPSRCDLRVRLLKESVQPVSTNVFAELLKEHGKRHEERHLRTFPAFWDLSERAEGREIGARREETLEALRRGEDVLYQPVLFGQRHGDGDDDSIVGIPDLLIREDDGYVVRECKLARNVSEKAPAEIVLQVQLYGWLLQQETGTPPVRLEVLTGANELVEVPYDQGASALLALDKVKRAASQPGDTYEPVGWSKCGPCGFFDRCWPQAQEAKDVALVPGVDQGLARYLHARGITTYDQMPANFTPEELAEVRRPVGDTVRRVGASAVSILGHAQAFIRGQVQHIGAFPLSREGVYVMFDLEGIPPQFDELNRVYMWGMQLFGSTMGPFRPALAPASPDGDEIGWSHFLGEAASIFRDFGDVPFIHWASYEKTMVNAYIKRYGDPQGIAQRVLDNLEDLYRITQKTVMLPASSYSLKTVEGIAGFQRTMDEYGGNWSIVQYVKAVESQDTEAYKEAMRQILRYNQEDLGATWAVFDWLALNYSGTPRQA